MSQATNLIQRLACPGYRFELTTEEGGREFLRVVCEQGVCNVTGKPMSWNGRKWRLSPHMTDMEVVNTAFLALTTALEHEARERFTVDGIPVMDSHRDLGQVLGFMSTGSGHGREEREDKCNTCGAPRSNHPYRHPFTTWQPGAR